MRDDERILDAILKTTHQEIKKMERAGKTEKVEKLWGEYNKLNREGVNHLADNMTRMHAEAAGTAEWLCDKYKTYETEEDHNAYTEACSWLNAISRIYKRYKEMRGEK